MDGVHFSSYPASLIASPHRTQYLPIQSACLMPVSWKNRSRPSAMPPLAAAVRLISAIMCALSICRSSPLSAYGNRTLALSRPQPHYRRQPVNTRPRRVSRVQMPHFEISWAEIVTLRRDSNDVPADEIDAAELAIAHLRSLFGDCVLKLPTRIVDVLFNRAPWTYEWLVWFSSSLQRLEKIPSYGCLRKRLLRPDDFEEALSVLRIAERFQEAGLLCTFDPAIEVEGNRKVPDLGIRDAEAGLAFYCEVSSLFRSDDDGKATAAFDRIDGLFRSYPRDPMIYAGRFLRQPSSRRLDELVVTIEAAKKAAIREDRLGEVIVPGLLELAFAPETGKEGLERWCHEHGIDALSFAGPPAAVDHIKRLEFKLQRKTQQLPSGMPNVLVVPAQQLFFNVQNPADLLPHVEEILHEHPKVGLLVLTTESIASVTPRVALIGAHLVIWSGRGGHDQRYLMVHNPYCISTFPRPTAEKREISVLFLRALAGRAVDSCVSTARHWPGRPSGLLAGRERRSGHHAPVVRAWFGHGALPHPQL